MLWTPPTNIKIVTDIPIVGELGWGTAVPSHGSIANTYGTITEIISAAANTQDSWGISVCLGNTGVVSTTCEASVDILIGGATDDTLIPSLLCGWTYESAIAEYFFPLHIPAGLRLAARLSSVRTTSFSMQVQITLYGGGIPPFPLGRKVSLLGSKVNNSRGQAITPSQTGAAASVSQMTASSTEQYIAFLPGYQPSGDTTILDNTVNVGIGLGASTEERIGTWTYRKDTTEKMTGPHPCMPVFRIVPAGTRITLLASNSGTNDSGNDGLIYAVVG